MAKIRSAGAIAFLATMVANMAGCASGAEDRLESAPVQNDATEQDESDILGENAQAVKETPSAAGATMNVCSSQLTPSGWVDVQWWNSMTCGSTFAPNSKQIKELTGYPIGTRVNACASTFPPPGWSITSSYYSSSCQYSAVPSFNNNSWSLLRTQ